MKTVAEFTTNHLGNFKLSLRMLEAAVSSGADYIKLQKKDIEGFYSNEELNSAYKSPYGKTYREYRSMFEFSKDEFLQFDQRCQELGAKWFVTAQDIASFEFMLDFDLPMYKISSINASNAQFLSAVKSLIPKEKTLVVSLAGLDLSHIENVLDLFAQQNKIIINHCVAIYPCPDEELRLGNIRVLKKYFGSKRIKIGYSGHECGLNGTYGAINMGADFVERHFCISRSSYAHHISCSLEPEEFKLIKIDNPTPNLPSCAFDAKFGMDTKEEKFLLHRIYGK